MSVREEQNARRRHMLVDLGMTRADVAAAESVVTSAISNWVRHHLGADYAHRQSLVRDAEAVRLYRMGLSTRDAARVMGCDKATVSRAVGAAGVDARTGGRPPLPDQQAATRRLLIARGARVADAARQVGISPPAFYAWIAKDRARGADR